MFFKQINISHFKRAKHIVLLLVLVGLFAQASANAAELKRIVVAGGDSFEPLLFLNADGEPDGIYVDLWRLWSEKTGVEVELKLMAWANAIPALRAGKVDAVDGVTYTPERAKFLDLSAPYTEIPSYIYFHESIGGVRELTDLEGFPVGVIGGSHVEDYLREEAPKLRPVPYVNYEEIVKAATEGRLRVFVGEDPIIPFMFAKMGKRITFRQTETPIIISDMRTAVRKGDTELLALIERGHKAITSTERQQIRDEWAGVSLTSQIPWRWLILGGVAIFTVVILAFLWNFQLRKQVGLKTKELSHELAERKRAEESLRQSEEIHRTVTNNVWDSIAIVQDAKVMWVNNVALDKMGYSEDEFVGLDFQKIIHSDDLPGAIQRYQDRMSGKPVEDPSYLRIITKEGKILEAENRGAVITWAGKPASVQTLRDITEEKRKKEEKKKMEAQLQQAQKMESIGTLAGGIAHDFNNILSSVIGYTELALDDIEKGSLLHYHIQEVLTSGLRASDLVKQILTFSRQADQELKPLKVQLVIKEVLKLMRASLPSTIEIKQHVSNKCGLVMADDTQIHQIAMNLMTNAYQAMEDEGGKMEVTLKEVDLGVEDLKDQSMTPGAYVCLTVADTGIGMEKSVLERIFDPYYSTKEKDKGTGLGLAVVHGIVKSYKGDIRVYSEPGEGTAFHVYLPVIKTQVETEEIDTITPVQKGTERILLVDDEEPIVRMETQMLERLGYHVTARTSSIEALEAFRAAPDQFDLVITDMTMPNMTGDILAKELINIRSDIPVILCTGFSEKMSKNKVDAFGIKGFLMKPIAKSDLAKTVREVLDES